MYTEALLKGDDYDELRESIIPWYTVRRTCLEKADVSIDDGAVVKMFNCTAYDKVENNSLRAFLKYVQSDSAESDFTRRISDMVEAQKELETTKKLYFSWSLHDHDVRKHGREEGRNEKAVESARNMLKDNLPIEKISQYTGLSLEKIIVGSLVVIFVCLIPWLLYFCN